MDNAENINKSVLSSKYLSCTTSNHLNNHIIFMCFLINSYNESTYILVQWSILNQLTFWFDEK